MVWFMTLAVNKNTDEIHGIRRSGSHQRLGTFGSGHETVTET